jgi:hypothetical protein
MSASTPLQLNAEDKLDLLRYLDEFHYWHSLDDKRRCKRCSRTITGRQIVVFELQGTRGRLRLQCPTVACVSTPSDWVYADPILAAKLRSDFRPGAPRTPAETISAERTHGATRARGKKNPATKTAGTVRTSKPNSLFAPLVSFRAVLARLALLRPIATAFHAIRPVA